MMVMGKMLEGVGRCDSCHELLQSTMRCEK